VCRAGKRDPEYCKAREDWENEEKKEFGEAAQAEPVPNRQKAEDDGETGEVVQAKSVPND